MDLYRQVLYLLQNTYSAQSTELIQKSENDLITLSTTDSQFPEILRQIILNPVDNPTRKSALLFVRHLSPEIIFPLFMEFNERLECIYHSLIMSLSETLANNYPEQLIEYLLNIDLNIDSTTENFNIKIRKSYFMAMSALLETISADEENKIDLMSKIIQQIIIINLQYTKAIFESPEIALFEDQVIFIHYLIKTIHGLFKLNFAGFNETPHFLYFIHIFLTASFQLDIDNLFPALKTKIIPTLLKIFSKYYSDEISFLNQDILNQFFENLHNYVQNKPLNEWPIQIMKSLKLYFQIDSIQHLDFFVFITNNFLLPFFSIDVYKGITDINQFIEIFSPYPNFDTIFSSSINVLMSLLFKPEQMQLIYQIALERLNQSNDLQTIFNVVHFMSYCILPYKYGLLESFIDTVIKPLSSIRYPPIILVIMHYLSSIPNIHLYIRKQPEVNQTENTFPSSDEIITSTEISTENAFPLLNGIITSTENQDECEMGSINENILSGDILEFVQMGIFNPFQFDQIESWTEHFQLPPESLPPLIQYYSILTFANFCDIPTPPFPQEMIHEVLGIALQIDMTNQYISESIITLIGALEELDDTSSVQLIEFAWKNFEALCQSDDPKTVANYLTCLMTIFKKSSKSIDIGNLILSLLENLLKSSQESETNLFLVSSLVEKYIDEFFGIIFSVNESFISTGLSLEDNTQLLVRFIENLNMILTLCEDNPVFDYEELDRFIMKFVNLKENIDHLHLLQLYQLLMTKIIESDWDTFESYSLKAYLYTFSQSPEVAAFVEGNKEMIDQFIPSEESEE